MKKFLFFAAMLCWLPLKGFTQNKPTCFLGIPIDGSKQEMIEKIKEKGFKYNVAEDFFVGFYYGYPVYVAIQSENNLVNRIIVYDIPQLNESEIKKRFNALCDKFNKDNRYVLLSESPIKIPKEEPVLREMRMHGKHYKGVYNQTRTNKTDSLAISARLTTESVDSIITKYQIYGLKEVRRRIHARALRHITGAYDGEHKRVVWFMLSEKFGKFAIILFYDNLNNFRR